MRCSRCGNENLDGNRFCGMCGATLLSAPPASPTLRSATPGATAPFAAPSPVRSQTAEAPRVPDDSPVISGPSFLGLSDPAPRKRASLSIDPHSSAARHPGIQATPLPGSHRQVLAVTYGEAPEPPAVARLLDVLSVTAGAERPPVPA